MIYFDNAATSGKKPQNVIAATEKALRYYSANPGRSGHSASVNTALKIYETRQRAANFFGAAAPEGVVFTSGCTHSINTVIKGLLKKGDKAVVSSLEHNSVIRPLVKIGADISVAEVSLTDNSKTVKSFAEKISKSTRLVICTGGSNVLGRLLPIEKIGELCREREVPFAVDAAQTAGVIPIDMQKMNIDYLCVAPHKGLYSPSGVGILICEKDIPDTLIEGGTGTNSEEPFQPDYLPERLESGTVNVPGILGLSAGMDFVKTKGIEKIYKHEMSIINFIFDGLSKMPAVTLYTPKPEAYEYAPVLSFNIKGIPSSEIAEYLNSKGIAVRGGLHCSPFAHKYIGTLPHGTVRISVSAFNNFSEAEYFLRTIKGYLRS